MNIKELIQQDKDSFYETVKRILKASATFARKTQKERNYVAQSFEFCKFFFDQAGARGLAFLFLSNNSVASNNELALIEGLTPQESLLMAGASKNLAAGKDISEGLPELSPKIKLLAQQHIISSQINELEESPFSAEMTFPYEINTDASVTIKPLPEQLEEPEND